MVHTLFWCHTCSRIKDYEVVRYSFYPWRETALFPLMIYSSLTANVRFDPRLLCILLSEAQALYSHFESRPACVEKSQLHLLCCLTLTVLIYCHAPQAMNYRT